MHSELLIDTGADGAANDSEVGETKESVCVVVKASVTLTVEDDTLSTCGGVN